MAILTDTIPVGAQIPAGGLGLNLGGGLIVGVYIPTDADGVTYDLEYSPDDGTTWDPISDEAGTALQLTFVSGGALHQINPPVRAPYFRLNGGTNEADAAFEYEVHTV